MTTFYGTAANNLPRIGAENLFRLGTITPSNGTGKYAVDWRADRVWAPGDGTQTLTVVLTAAATVDYAFLAMHNLGTVGADVAIQRLVADAWVTVAAFSPDSDGPAWVSISPVSASQWRVVITSPADTAPAIAVLSIGQALVLDEGLQPGWAPPVFAASSDVVDSVSEDGLLIARTLRRRPDDAMMNLNNVSETWMHTTWRPVRDRLIRQPWALAWSPLESHGDCALCWTDGMPASDTYPAPGFFSIRWQIRMLSERDVSALDSVQEEIPVIIASITILSTLYYGEAVAITEPETIVVDDFPS